MTASAEEIKAFIISTLRHRLTFDGVDVRSMPDDFDLRARGVIDSLGFILLLDQIESRFGVPISLADVPGDQLTKIGVLCTHLASQMVLRRDR